MLSKLFSSLYVFSCPKNIEGINGLSYEKGNIDQLAQKITQINQIVGNPQKIASSIEQFYTENYFKRLDSVFEEILQ